MIVLGSTSQTKIRALRSALFCLEEWAQVEVAFAFGASGVSAQPCGYEETLLGARNRAKSVRQAHPQADIALGVENGIRLNGEVWEDWAIVVAIDRHGKERIVESQAISFPTDAVEEARRRGFAQTTVGLVLHERHQCPAHDPHRFLTNGTWSREAILRDAFIHLFELLAKGRLS